MNDIHACPGMRVHPILRAIWLAVPILMLPLLVYNLAYCIAYKSSPIPPVSAGSSVATPTVDMSKDGPDQTICSLQSVECPSEKAAVVSVSTPAPTKPQIVEKKTPVTAPIKKGAPDWKQERINYAWEISHDLDFILTLEKENDGTWLESKLSDLVGANGFRDKGICQVNIGYHPEVVFNKNFKDWKWQIDTCRKMYVKGVRFYGFDHRQMVLKNFIIASN